MQTGNAVSTWMKTAMIGLALGSLALGFAGCETEDDDENTDGIGGIWRHTVVENGSTVLQETVELAANGVLNVVSADFINQECFSMEGTWSASADSITTTVMGITTTDPYTLAGDAVTIVDEEGVASVYSRVSSMPTCDDYGFGGSGGWDGTFSATVNGNTIDFSSNLYVESEQDLMGFGGFNGTQNLAFVVNALTAGTYDEDIAAGTYMPNINVTTDAYISTTMSLNLTTVDSAHIAGSFNFEAMNPFTMQTLTVNNGQINITHN